jgi:FkbM family methyltransferase
MNPSAMQRKLSTWIRNLLWKGAELLPLSWRLEFRVCLMKLRLSDFEEEWHQLHRLGTNKGVAVDIGANRGYYTLRLAGLYDSVVAIEPNEEICRELIARAHPKVWLENVALSSAPGTETLFVPLSADGEMLVGWGSFDAENLESASAHREILARVIRLDDMGLEDVSFIKMDVEGHEREVLEGALRLLAEQHPTLLMEIKKGHEAGVSSLLSSIGYRQGDLARHMGEAPGNEMYLFSQAGTLEGQSQ